MQNQKIIEYCRFANFKEALELVKSQHVEVPVAVKVVVASCGACHSNLITPEIIDECTLVELLKYIIGCIHMPTNDGLQNYMQSAFHILKLLIEKKNYDAILQLEDFFIPQFMPLLFTEKQTQIYQSICKITYNVIVKAANLKEKNNEHSCLQLAFLVTKIYRKINDVTSLLETTHNCIVALSQLTVNAEDLLKFYTHVLHQFNRIDDRSVFPLFINNFSCLYVHLLKCEQFTLASNCHMHTAEKIGSLFVGQEYRCLLEILRVVEWINPNAETHPPIKHVHANFKTYYKQYKSTRNLQSLCDVISSVSHVVLPHYKKSNRWLDSTESVHAEYYAFLNDVAHILSLTAHKCSCKTCTTQTNLNEALRTLNAVAGLGRLYIQKKVDVSRTYKVDILRSLDTYVRHLSILQANNCLKWRNYWFEAGAHLYNIGIHLFNIKDSEMCVLYLRKFVQVLIQLEGLNSQIIGRTYLRTALSSIAEDYAKNKDYEKVMLATALNLVVNCSETEIHRWIRTKVACRDSMIANNNPEIQAMNLVSVFMQCGDELRHYYPTGDFHLTKKQQEELLVYELQSYKLKWKSKIPMMTAFKELITITSPQRAGEVFIDIWGGADIPVHEDIPQLLQTTVKGLEREPVPDSDVLLAFLYFLQHKYGLKDTILKHCDEMDRTLNMTKTEHAGPIPPDPDEECDIVSSYDCLKLHRYLGMMKRLNKSSDMVEVLFSKVDVDDLKNKDILYGLLANLGHEYRLHSHVTKSLRAWELALQVAASADDHLHVLEATGFVVEQSDVRKPVLRELMERAEEVVAQLEVKAHMQELITYFLCKAEAYCYVDFDEAYGAYERALKYRAVFYGNSIITARFYYLEHKFNTLPCRFEVKTHRENSLVMIYLAHAEVNKHYAENWGESAYDMRIYFEISEFLVKMCHDMRLARETRCYGKEVVTLAQRVVLPLRTVSFLYYLAHEDIRSGRFDDCRVKVMGISDILGLSKGKNTIKSPVAVSDEVVAFQQFENLVDGFDEIMLDVPARAAELKTNGSPSFRPEKFKIPSFLNHQDSCDCFYCTCLEYQDFVLRKNHVHTLLHLHEADLTSAKDYFRGSLMIYEYLKNKDDVYQKKVAKKLSKEFIPVPGEYFVEIYCHMLLESCNCLIRRDQFARAISVNKKMLDILEPFNLQYIHLYNDALAQRLDIIMAQSVIKPSAPKITLEKVDLNEAMIVATPKTKVNKVFVSPPRRFNVLDTLKINIKSVKFDLSDEEESVQLKQGATPKHLPARYRENRTPAPSSSKIKIYTDKSKKKLIDVPSLKHTEFLLPGNPDAQTPKSESEQAVRRSARNRK